jgi:hypothetical protein
MKHNKTVGWVVLITMVVSFMALMSQRADANPGDPDTTEGVTTARCAWPDRYYVDGSSWDRIQLKEESTLEGFLDHRGEPCYFDWSTNRCSFSPDNPNNWDFWKGCIRHDFLYRNLIQMEQRYNQNFWSVHNESTADMRLFLDLKGICTAANAGSICVNTADTYYKAVCRTGASECCPGRPDLYNDGHCIAKWQHLTLPRVWVKHKAVSR